MRTFAFLAFLILLSVNSPLNAQIEDDFTGITLPSCPRKCIVKVYMPLAFDLKQISHFPIIDKQRYIIDVKPYFESVGMTFPKGGYAWFFRTNKMLIIATTQKNLDLIEALGPIE